jgi:flagellar motor switch protein FliN/FliY
MEGVETGMDFKTQFVNCVVQAIAGVFSQALGAQWKVATSADDAGKFDAGSYLSIVSTISGKLQGTAALQVKNADAVRLAQLFLGEPPDGAGGLDDDRKEAVLELARQVTGVAATNMKPTFGEVGLQVSLSDSPSESAARSMLIASTDPDINLAFALEFNEALLASLSTQSNEATQEATGDEIPAEKEAVCIDRGNPERVMDVFLKASLRFGQCLLTLQDITDLNSGMIVELDRQVEEPVDLVIEDKVIARGRVVIVDGNYGLEVSEYLPFALPNSVKAVRQTQLRRGYPRHRAMVTQAG